MKRSNPRKKSTFAVVLGILALSTVLLAGTVQAEKKLLIGTTSSSSSHYGYFVAVSQIINKMVDGVDSSVVETGATMDNLRRIDRKQIDLGLVTTNVLHAAYYGTGSFEGKPVKSKLLWVYVIAPQNAIVRADSGINSLAELAGKKFNPGLKGSATEKTSEAVFSVLGIAPEYVRGSTGDIVAAVKDNRVNGYVKSGSGLNLDASSRDIATMTAIKILGLSADQKQKVLTEMPELSIVDVPQNGDYPPYTTWGFAVAASAGLELDEETAYQIVKSICEDKEEQAAAFSGVKGVDFIQHTLKYATVPLHPGAIKYFQEQGVDIPEKLIEK